MRLRRSCSPNWEMSTPSMQTRPSAASIIRNKANVTDDFPAPVLPTMPTFSCGWIEAFNCLTTRSRVGRYLKADCSNSRSVLSWKPGIEIVFIFKRFQIRTTVESRFQIFDYNDLYRKSSEFVFRGKHIQMFVFYEIWSSTLMLSAIFKFLASWSIRAIQFFPRWANHSEASYHLRFPKRPQA